ncbi:DUF4129 domain-containing protein [Jatrophihabitans endophyticus]|uniref:DUF4129 domain-containing protein n=1 Tax=Jatrophihabitans endophyticus TaxID=1206085 RepID=UPI0019E8F946|nr:DUF4129 domain-containing protein [Jatrophihabitans endophyticus]MBE7190020.1 DUF4129 domain-containing protein [Jatrophihabitans endophyticus]
MTTSGTGRGPVGGGAARRAARHELARSEYRHPGPGWPTRAAHWAGHQLDRLFSGGTGSDALLLVVVVLVVIAVLLAVRAGAPARRAAFAGGDAADPLAPVTSRDHRRIAADLAARGEHREALREWLRAAVQTIEERGVLPPRPGRTGAMTAREAGPLLPAAAGSLAAATAVFDEVWFGDRTATAADAELARSAADAVAGARIVRGAAGPGMAVPQ